MHIPKKGLRALGIAESYAGREYSTLAGVVMRKDLRIDGFCFGRVTVGGSDETDTILGMIHDLDRRDINIVLLSGCVIAWFNVIDPGRIAEESGIPVICVTYEESDGLLDDLQHHFPEDEERKQAADLGGHRTIYLRAAGIGYPDAAHFCRDFTLDGKIPEPLRVARLCARQVFPVQRSA